MISKNPVEDIDEYTEAALNLYRQLPETPLRPSDNDRRTAETLYARGISLTTLESALLTASIRRLARSPELHPLSPIRSLAYFLPVIEEILFNPVPNDYLTYLRKKVELLSSRRKSITRA